MGLKVTMCRISDLKHDETNVRLHDDRNRDALRKSIENFGIRKPVVAQQGTNIVYAGNLTLSVAKEMGVAELPVAWLPGYWETEECLAYAIADNRTAELASWDDSGLAEVLDALADNERFTLEDVGFDEDELAELMKVPLPSTNSPNIPSGNDTECPNCGHQFNRRNECTRLAQRR